MKIPFLHMPEAITVDRGIQRSISAVYIRNLRKCEHNIYKSLPLMSMYLSKNRKGFNLSKKVKSMIPTRKGFLSSN
jgi:hypothetical protein